MVIKSKRLLLSPLSQDELRAKILSEQDEHLSQAFRQMLQGSLDNPGYHNWYTLWSISLIDGTVVGSLAFMGQPENGAVELGCGIDKPFEGQGYATEAVRQICKWAFSIKDVYFITAETAPENTASQRVLEKCGFKHTDKTGDEGPIFELEKEKPSNMSIYISIGMCFGIAIGTATDNLAFGLLNGTSMDNLAIGLSLGAAVGVSVGLALDSRDNKKRMKFSKLRESKNEKKS